MSRPANTPRPVELSDLDTFYAHQLDPEAIRMPIFARAATDNLGSLRVLQKGGFQIIGQDQGFAHGRGSDTEEYILRLDADSNR
jgi:hypothetical protein